MRKMTKYNFSKKLEITGATLLSIEEVKRLPIRLRDYEYLWWLRSPGHAKVLSAFVYFYGVVVDIGSGVDHVHAVRPALKISNLKSSNLKLGDVFTFGYKRFEIVSDNLAFCLGDIGRHLFREDWRAEDANDYENSDVKRFVDKWFTEAKEDAEIH